MSHWFVPHTPVIPEEEVIPFAIGKLPVPPYTARGPVCEDLSALGAFVCLIYDHDPRIPNVEVTTSSGRGAVDFWLCPAQLTYSFCFDFKWGV